MDGIFILGVRGCDSGDKICEDILGVPIEDLPCGKPVLGIGC